MTNLTEVPQAERARPGGKPPGTRPRMRWRGALVAAAALVLLLLALLLPDGVPRGDAEHYGAASVLSALLTMVLVFITPQAILSLIVGSRAGYRRVRGPHASHLLLPIGR